MKNKFLTAVMIMVVLSMSSNLIAQQIQSAGSLEFSPTGTLFVGDNIGGAIYAFEVEKGEAPKEPALISVENIDARVASILGVGQNAVVINDLAVHPITREVYLSVTRGFGLNTKAAIVKIDGKGGLTNINLKEVKSTRQALNNLPDGSQKFRVRGTMAPPTRKEIAKSESPMRTLSIIDMLYHKGELFVAGISNEDFASTLRRLPYPFTGKQSASNIEMYHIAHDQYETRAPIRSMVIKEIDGKDQLIAAYTCSPIVIIPLDELKDGAKVTAKTIGDMGNGQPIDMVSFNLRGNEMLFVSNNSRMPQVIPVGGLQNAKTVTDKDFERGMKMDLGPIMPYGPVGQPVMFEGASLQIALLNETHFVSLTRDAKTGSLDIESLHTFFPNKLHNLHAEMDFPGFIPKPKKKK
jgi:hypothetical protein